ncbi:MAG: hypothetical protein ACI85J_001812 [Candidatus Poriferisodalaceae bacterium]
MPQAQPSFLISEIPERLHIAKFYVKEFERAELHA